MEVKVHGGVHILGNNNEVKNLELEELTTDPTTAEIGRIWFNTTQQRIRFVFGRLGNGRPNIASVFTTLDSEALQSLITSKSDRATTLAGYGITDAVKANATITAGTATKVTYDNKGLITTSSALSAADIPNLDWAKITTGKPTTLAGYGITDAGKGVVLQVIGGVTPPSSGTTVVLYGTTAPSILQGTQLWAQAITLANANNRVVLEFNGIADLSSSNANIVISIFRGATFLGCTTVSSGKNGTDVTQSFSLRIIDKPGVVNPATYSCRIGVSIGAWYLGRGYSATLGGANPSTWSVSEII